MSQRPDERPTARSATILVTGGTGTLGRAFDAVARRAGHRVRIMSRRPEPSGADRTAEREWARADLTTGEGLDAALRDVDVVLHAATDSLGDPESVDVEGTGRLLDAAGRHGVRHLIYPSIVGVDRMPYYYYDVKVRAEALIRESAVPHTTIRISQFHSFVDRILRIVGRLPLLMPLPTRAKVQSIGVEDAAAHLLEWVEGEPAGRAPDVAGPEILTLGEMARSWCRARGTRRWVVRLPIPGKTAGGFRKGYSTAPEGAVGTETWGEWLGRAYGGAPDA